jgi:para-aminobenzoate synthetase
MKAVSLPHCKTSDTDQSDAEFAFASAVVSYEHATGLWQVSGLVRLEGWLGDEIECEKEMQCRFGLDEVEWSEYSRKIQTYFSSPCTPSDTKLFAIHSPLSADDLTSDLSESDYKPAIESARTSIIAGDAYELCLTTQFRATLPSTLASDPYPLYRSLRQSNPAPYSAYFNLPQSNLAILSSSPERYMRITKEGEVEMKPIKGTVRRSSDPIEDERRKDELAKDEKEIAENLMIVDLCRNDLLAFCEVESVLVPRLMVVETYETVHQ